MTPGTGCRSLPPGASGGVGSFLVQLAALRGGGAQVVGVCSGPNLVYARDLGAAAAMIDYTTEAVGEALRARCPEGVDAIVDLVGDKAALTALSGQLRPGGRVASAVDPADVEQLAGRGIRRGHRPERRWTEFGNELLRARPGAQMIALVGQASLEPENLGDAMVDRHAEALARLETRLRTAPGELSPHTRAAAIDADPLPDPLAQGYVETIRRHAYKLTDRHLEELGEAGWTDGQVFELTVAAAFGAAKRRLDAGLGALDEAAGTGRPPGEA